MLDANLPTSWDRPTTSTPHTPPPARPPHAPHSQHALTPHVTRVGTLGDTSRHGGRDEISCRYRTHRQLVPTHVPTQRPHSRPAAVARPFRSRPAVVVEPPRERVVRRRSGHSAPKNHCPDGLRPGSCHIRNVCNRPASDQGRVGLARAGRVGRQLLPQGGQLGERLFAAPRVVHRRDHSDGSLERGVALRHQIEREHARVGLLDFGGVLERARHLKASARPGRGARVRVWARVWGSASIWGILILV